LLHTGDILCNVLDGDGVFDRKTVRLCFQPGLVYQDACVGVEPRERETYVIIDESNLARSDACVLEFHGGAFLAAEDYDGGSFHANGARATLDGFDSIFYLEDVAIGTVRGLVGDGWKWRYDLWGT
jgi:hypothetical protein